MRLEVLPRAREDIIAGHNFYENQAQGLGSHFRRAIFETAENPMRYGRRAREVLRLSPPHHETISVRHLLQSQGQRRADPRYSRLP